MYHYYRPCSHTSIPRLVIHNDPLNSFFLSGFHNSNTLTCSTILDPVFIPDIKIITVTVPLLWTLFSYQISYTHGTIYLTVLVLIQVFL